MERVSSSSAVRNKYRNGIFMTRDLKNDMENIVSMRWTNSSARYRPGFLLKKNENNKRTVFRMGVTTPALYSLQLKKRGNNSDCYGNDNS